MNVISHCLNRFARMDDTDSVYVLDDSLTIPSPTWHFILPKIQTVDAFICKFSMWIIIFFTHTIREFPHKTQYTLPIRLGYSRKIRQMETCQIRTCWCIYMRGLIRYYIIYVAYIFEGTVVFRLNIFILWFYNYCNRCGMRWMLQ